MYACSPLALVVGVHRRRDVSHRGCVRPHCCNALELSRAQGGRPRPSPAVVGDGVQIFVKPPRRRASAAGDDAAPPDQPAAKAAKQPRGRDAELPDPQSVSRASVQPLVHY